MRHVVFGAFIIIRQRRLQMIFRIIAMRQAFDAAAKAQPFLLTGKPVFRQRFYHPVLKMDCLKRSITDFGGAGL
ncbi:hypothetical protein [Gluconobacter cerinus]|uniref:hypothetical protein n=1 Tax=Gluconobacter cerinus TaxID=38307 RepID=UPI001E436158|nr:hypothetical protein [Gluconobacter cerinus]